jgi:hypothetical protein
MKTLWKIFGIVLLIGIIYVIAVYASYAIAVRKINEESRIVECEYQTSDNFTGIIKRINRYEYSKYMNEHLFALEISVFVPKDTLIDYQFDINNFSDLLKNTRIGDTIKKLSGNKIFTLEKNGGIDYLMPDCEK